VGGRLPARRVVGSWLHGETRDIGVEVAQPREGLAEIRSVAAAVLPGATSAERPTTGMYFAGLSDIRTRCAPVTTVTIFGVTTYPIHLRDNTFDAES
jgi:hypothetical protein